MATHQARGWNRLTTRLRSVAVVDLGRARFKALVMHRSGERVLEARQTEEVGRSIADGQTPQRALLTAAERLVDFVAREGGAPTIVLGAAAFREGGKFSDMAPALEAVLGRISVLSPAEEAGMFYRGVTEVYPDAGMIVDVGGGSVQVAGRQRDGMIATGSIDAGTFSLEERFGLGVGAPESAFDAARTWILDSLAEIAMEIVPAGVLVVGSSQMASFFAALRSGEKEAGALWSQAEVEAQLTRCRAMHPDEFATVFPANPGFMYGADKALLVVACAMAALGASSCRPTDESVSTALARAALAGDSLAMDLIR